MVISSLTSPLTDRSMHSQRLYRDYMKTFAIFVQRTRMSCNILFLDFDGVLTSDAYTQRCILECRRENLYGIDWFDPDCIAALQLIIDKTQAKIVISSSWIELGIEKLNRLWNELQMPGVLYEMISDAPHSKKEAIKQWLKGNGHHAYAILDDDDLGLQNQVKTNPRTGLTLSDAEKAIALILQK